MKRPRFFATARVPDAATARACLATNLALPGFGTLMAGRWIGWVQALLTVAAFALTLVGGVNLFLWYAAHRAQFNDPFADPVENLRALWRVARWPLLGMGLFALSWLWALGSSLQTLRAARRTDATPPRPDAPGTPPRLNAT